MPVLITPEAFDPILIQIAEPSPIYIEAGISGKPGKPGEDGPPGPEGGTPVVALPYTSWPPVNPQPDTLYLRLAP